MGILFADLSTGETILAAKERADLLREALQTLSDKELVVINARSAGLSYRETGIHAGYCHVHVMRLESSAMAKLRTWFAARCIAWKDLF